MFVKVSKHVNRHFQPQPQAIATIQKVKVVKAQPKVEELVVKETKPNVMRRVTFLRPLTESHARQAWNQLFAAA